MTIAGLPVLATLAQVFDRPAFYTPEFEEFLGKNAESLVKRFVEGESYLPREQFE